MNESGAVGSQARRMISFFYALTMRVLSSQLQPFQKDPLNRPAFGFRFSSLAVPKAVLPGYAMREVQGYSILTLVQPEGGRFR